VILVKTRALLLAEDVARGKCSICLILIISNKEIEHRQPKQAEKLFSTSPHTWNSRAINSLRQAQYFGDIT
jgi:hypothetical protein